MTTEDELYAWLVKNAERICDFDAGAEPIQTPDQLVQRLVALIMEDAGLMDMPMGWMTRLRRRVRKVWEDEDIDPEFWDCVEFINKVADLKLAGGTKPPKPMVQRLGIRSVQKARVDELYELDDQAKNLRAAARTLMGVMMNDKSPQTRTNYDVVAAELKRVEEKLKKAKQENERLLTIGKGGHRPIEQFSTPVRKVLEAMSIHEVNVVGSAGDHKAMYSADFDLMESVPLTNKATQQFQLLVKRACAVGVVTDIKCGQVPEWNLVDGNYDREKERDALAKLHDGGIITDTEFKHGQSLLRKGLRGLSLVTTRQELRFGVLRWTPTEVAKGKKVYRGRTFTLKECFTTGITKVDLVAWIGDRYAEVSSIIGWTKNGKPVVPPVDTMKQDIDLYASQGNWFKVAKRLYSLAKQQGKGKTMKDLENVLNSHLGQIGTVVSDLELLKEFPTETKKHRAEELDEMRDRMAKLYYPKYDHATNPSALLPTLWYDLQAATKKELVKLGLV